MTTPIPFAALVCPLQAMAKDCAEQRRASRVAGGNAIATHFTGE